MNGLENTYVHHLLFEAAAMMKKQINSMVFTKEYSSESRERVLKLYQDMDTLRRDLDLELPIRPVAGANCTAYAPYLNDELRPLEIECMKHYYPQIDTLISNANNVSEEWQSGQIPEFDDDDRLCAKAGLLAEAIIKAAGHCRMNSTFISFWYGNHVYMAGPTRLDLADRKRCDLLWAIYSFNPGCTGEYHRIGLSIEDREVWISVAADLQQCAWDFEVLLVRGDPMPASWGVAAPVQERETSIFERVKASLAKEAA